MDGEHSLGLTDREIAACFSEPAWAERFPPVLSIERAAALLDVPVGTLRDWRSRGLLRGCCRRAGKRVLFFRDRLLKLIFNEGLNDD